jgi:ATP-dependent DNA ligase
MLARTAGQLPAEDAMPGGCLYEPKFDGYRALLFVNADRCRVQSRRGHNISASFPDVAESATDQLPNGFVLDGELVVWNDGRLRFSELQLRLASKAKAAQRAREAPASFVAFDVLCVDG